MLPNASRRRLSAAQISPCWSVEWPDCAAHMAGLNGGAARMAGLCDGRELHNRFAVHQRDGTAHTADLCGTTARTDDLRDSFGIRVALTTVTCSSRPPPNGPVWVHKWNDHNHRVGAFLSTHGRRARRCGFGKGQSWSFSDVRFLNLNHYFLNRGHS
jgi:hypothetical protein